MICYLNRGIVIEQALVDLIHSYFDSLNFENIYPNFHLEVTTQHPFADLYLHDNLNASDVFPAIVVTTEEDKKTSELSSLRQETDAVGLTADDIDKIVSNHDQDGILIPGLCNIVDETKLQELKDVCERQTYVYGLSIVSRRTDNISIEIWAENNQLKNEIYEQLRLFILGNLRHILNSNPYKYYDFNIDDDTVNGQRSNNYNFDFDVALCGAHITFEINYLVQQLILDTDLDGINKEIVLEVTNRVKGY